MQENNDTLARQRAISAALMRLVDAYAEIRHTCGSPTYNAKSKAARDDLKTAVDRLSEIAVKTTGKADSPVVAVAAPTVATGPSDAEIDACARSMLQQPWGIGSRIEDARAFGRRVLSKFAAPRGHAAAPAGVAGTVKFTAAHVSYIARYGGHCRDCADEGGICPGRGLPCADSEKAIRFVLEALAYGINHGYIADPKTP